VLFTHEKSHATQLLRRDNYLTLCKTLSFEASVMQGLSRKTPSFGLFDQIVLTLCHFNIFILIGKIMEL